MAGSDDGRWDPPRDDDEEDEDYGYGEDDDDDNRVIVGKTRFTREDFAKAYPALPGAKWPLLFVPVALAFVLVNFSVSRDLPGFTGVLVLPFVFIAMLAYAAWSGVRGWVDKAFAELHGAHDVTFRFDSEGLAVETSKRKGKTAWEVLHRALETKLAFLVYTRANAVEVIPKRAFAASDLDTLKRWLRERIPARPAPRTLKNTLVLWIVLIVAFLLIWQFLNGGDTSR